MAAQVATVAMVVGMEEAEIPDLKGNKWYHYITHT